MLGFDEFLELTAMDGVETATFAQCTLEARHGKS